MPKPIYDPQKAHDYYEKHKQLKGRDGKGGNAIHPKNASAGHPAPLNHPLSSGTQSAIARVGRLKAAVSKLQSALSEAEAALSKKRQTAKKTAAKNSDGKTTAKERAAAKAWRDKNKSKVAAESKKKGGSSSSSSSVSSLSADELSSRITKIKSALADAKRQLSSAQQQLGQLAHSDLTSEPSLNEHFARFRSAERIPSK